MIRFEAERQRPELIKSPGASRYLIRRRTRLRKHKRRNQTEKQAEEAGALHKTSIPSDHVGETGPARPPIRGESFAAVENREIVLPSSPAVNPQELSVFDGKTAIPA
jgi:hypothetical protein